MAVPDYQSLMLPVLTACANGETRIGTLADTLPDTLGLSADDRSEMLPSGTQSLLHNRIHWAKTYLTKAGLVETTRRGYFRITPRGQDVLQAPPSRIDNKFLLQFEEFRQFYRRDKNDTVTPPNGRETGGGDLEPTPDEIMRAAHDRIENELAQELLQRIMASSPQFFERCIVNLLLGMGYGGSASEAGRAIGRSGDDGIDGVIDQDSLGLDRVYIQAKRYAVGNNIGSGAIRDFFGSLDRHKASKGLFVTTSTFSPAARETASLLSKRIVLLDGEQMARLMIRHNVGCRIEETLHIRKIDEDFFD